MNALGEKILQFESIVALRSLNTKVKHWESKAFFGNDFTEYSMNRSMSLGLVVLHNFIYKLAI